MFKITGETKLNAEWAKYNDMHNEGAEGFNPYVKYITTTTTAEKKQIGNKVYTFTEAVETLKKLEDALSKQTDATKRKQCQDLADLFKFWVKQ